MILGFAFFALGALCAIIVYFSTRSVLAHEIALKENYAGKKISTLGGLVVLVSLLLASALLIVIPHIEAENKAAFGLLFIALGFGFLGLLDDLVGDKSSQGFRGHLSALLQGRVTTGSLKLFGGPAVALIALSPNIAAEGYLRVFVDVVAISLIANFFNLLDLAPGRCSKYVLAALTICAIVAPTLAFQYCVIGIVAVVLILDLREVFMLGDTGANMLGAMVGLAIVSCSSFAATIIIAAVAFGLNLLSEFVSYSSVINSFVPLRAFDRLGQTSGRRSWKKSQ